MSIRLVFSQAQPQEPQSRKGFLIDVGDVVESAFGRLIAENVLTKAQAILAIEDGLIEMGEEVDTQVERRIMIMINVIASAPVGPKDI